MMATQQQNDETQQAPQAPHPARPQPRLQFHWAWILVPLALLLMAYMLHHSQPAVTWEQIMNMLGVKNRERYTQLLHLCLVLTLIVAAVRILRHRR